jgi:hypothetical protein
MLAETGEGNTAENHDLAVGLSQSRSFQSLRLDN